MAGGAQNAQKRQSAKPVEATTVSKNLTLAALSWDEMRNSSMRMRTCATWHHSCVHFVTTLDTPGLNSPEISMNRTLKSALCAAALGFAFAASAAPVVITASLTGDPRISNPDNLIIDVTITFDTTSNVANWVVDINSPLHPNAKLDEFYFNMSGALADYSFSGFSPVGWEVTSPASTAGGGSISFNFEALDPAGPPNAADVTNSTNLTFTMTKASGNLLASDFLSATSTCSSDATLGCGQLGAHLQSLVAGQGQSDSGFLLGNYEGGGDEEEIPEPMTLALVGLGLLGTAFARRRVQR
jgi:hypothetical protein